MRPCLPGPRIQLLSASMLLAAALACGDGVGPVSSGGVTPPVTNPWSVPQSLENWSSTDAQDPVVAVDYEGKAVVTWNGKANAASSGAIWANTYTPSYGWSGVLGVESLAGEASGQKIAMNEDGLATLVWTQDTGTRSIQSFRYTPLGGFTGLVSEVTVGSGDAMMPSVAVDRYGNAIAVWVQVYNGNYHVMARRYLPASGWGSTLQLDFNDPGTEARYPVVAMDPSGNAVVAWHQAADLSQGPFTVMACTYALNQGWSAPRNLHVGYDAWNPAVAMTDAGVQVVWQAVTGGGAVRIFTSSYAALQGWNAPGPLSNAAAQSDLPSVGMDRAGNCIVAWNQKVSDSNYSIAATRYSVTRGWEDPASFDHGTQYASIPAVSMNGSGTAVIAWAQKAGSDSNVYAVRYRNGWEQTFLVSPDEGGQAYSPAVSVGASGDIWATWMQVDPATQAFNILASSYLP